MGAEPLVASLALADVVTVMRVLLHDERTPTGATSALPEPGAVSAVFDETSRSGPPVSGLREPASQMRPADVGSCASWPDASRSWCQRDSGIGCTESTST